MLQMTLAGDELRIRPVKLAHVESASHWLHELYLMYAPVRQQAQSHTEAEIDADINAALSRAAFPLEPRANACANRPDANL